MKYFLKYTWSLIKDNNWNMMVYSKIVEEERYYRLDNLLVKMMRFLISFMRANK